MIWKVLAHFEVYEFHPVVAALQVFCSEDLGAFYLDAIKDRLYELGAVYASMSGSGSSLYGLFRNPVSLDSFNADGTFKQIIPLS